jgi:hypothetical protein
MLADYLIAPSLNAVFITGTLLIIVTILIIINFKELTKLNLYQKISLLCILVIAFGSHGLIHLGIEKQYNFNPYKWF